MLNLLEGVLAGVSSSVKTPPLGGANKTLVFTVKLVRLGLSVQRGQTNIWNDKLERPLSKGISGPLTTEPL